MDTQTILETPGAATPSVVQIPTSGRLLAFEVRMPVLPPDFRAMAATLEAAYAEHGEIDLLVKVVGAIHFRFELFREGLIGVKRNALRHVDRYAVVGGPRWLAKAVALLNPLFRLEVRRFEIEDEEAAWAWLGGREKTASA